MVDTIDIISQIVPTMGFKLRVSVRLFFVCWCH